MQIRLLHKDDIEEKVKTRSLYEENFDIGDDDFIDYYYDTIIKRNEVVVVENNGEIISMIHLNPYDYNVLGNIEHVHYFVALATKKDYRNMGYMKKAIDFAINYLNQLKEPFCYIVPENDGLERFYNRFGFVRVCKFTLDKFSRLEYDIFPHNSEEYNELMIREDEFLKLETEEYRQNLSKKNVLFKVLANDKGLRIDDLCQKRIYVCQEV